MALFSNAESECPSLSLFPFKHRIFSARRIARGGLYQSLAVAHLEQSKFGSRRAHSQVATAHIRSLFRLVPVQSVTNAHKLTWAQDKCRRLSIAVSFEGHQIWKTGGSRTWYKGWPKCSRHVDGVQRSAGSWCFTSMHMATIWLL